ncbi:MAG: squalene/phytoene synthase family protein [Candidatus Rokuibacteriota bacterium]
MTGPRERFLLRELLPGVSRSFALSLAVLPASLRVLFGVTYLLARAADTIADTRALPPRERRQHVDALRATLRSGDGRALDRVATLLTPDHPPGERRLLERLDDVVAAYRAFDSEDRARAQALLFTLTQAMLDALARFPPEGAGRVVALDTRADLDRYTYMNAGCVGEFWTDMVVAHRPRCRGWNVPLMRSRGVRFGQGLQLTNVLRDLPRDLRTGRCYLPRQELAALALGPEDLLDRGVLPRLRPLLAALVMEALGHLQEALAYTLAVPRREVRLRLACAWPLLIALATLARIIRAPDLLDPAITVKVPRREVRRSLWLSAALVASNRGLRAYANRLAATVAA